LTIQRYGLKFKVLISSFDLNVKAGVVEQGRWSQMIIRTLLSEGEDEIKCILYLKLCFLRSCYTHQLCLK